MGLGTFLGRRSALPVQGPPRVRASLGSCKTVLLSRQVGPKPEFCDVVFINCCTTISTRIFAIFSIIVSLFIKKMIRAIATVSLFVNVAAFAPVSPARFSRLQMTAAPPGYKPMADGTFKKAGDHLPEYLLECEGAKAIVRTYGGNCFTYITKDGIEVFGTRKDAVDPRSDSKPFAGGNPHCFPQFGPGPPTGMQHGFARGMKWIPEERAKKLSFDRMIFKLEPTEVTSYRTSYIYDANIYHPAYYIFHLHVVGNTQGVGS